MTARVIVGRVDAFEAISLENDALRVMVIPELGAHVTELTDRVADRDLLWHNPRTTLRRCGSADEVGSDGPRS